MATRSRSLVLTRVSGSGTSIYTLFTSPTGFRTIIKDVAVFNDSTLREVYVSLRNAAGTVEAPVFHDTIPAADVVTLSPRFMMLEPSESLRITPTGLGAHNLTIAAAGAVLPVP